MKFKIASLPTFCAMALTTVLGLTTLQAEPRVLSSRGESLDRVVAIVNDGVVLSSELDAETARIAARLKQQNTELPADNVLRKQVLDRLIQQELQLQRAQRGGLKVSDEMLNSALNDIAGRNNVKFSDLPAAIESQGQNYATYREEVRRDMTLQILQQQAVIANINVTPRELDQFLAKQQRTPDANAQYNLSHILVSVNSSSSTEELAAREARANEVLSKAQAGQNFAELAVAYSDSSTNIDGGSLGWRSGAQLPSVVADSIPSLKVGDVTKVIRTPSGFHIFKLNDKRGGDTGEELQSQVHARHILLKTTEIEDDNTVKQRLEKIRARIQAGEDFAAIAAVTSQDTGSAVQGGDLGWAGPGTFVGEFEKTLDQLDVNQISEPFKSQFGWHIVQLLGRRTQDVSEENRRNKAFAALRESKAEEEVELWLRELRADAYVEYLM
ncbi:MAG: peptidylprolyl isomerase [Steroidobacteraceae bacterium]